MTAFPIPLLRNHSCNMVAPRKPIAITDCILKVHTSKLIVFRNDIIDPPTGVGERSVGIVNGLHTVIEWKGVSCRSLTAVINNSCSEPDVKGYWYACSEVVTRRSKCFLDDVPLAQSTLEAIHLLSSMHRRTNHHSFTFTSHDHGEHFHSGRGTLAT